MPPPTQVMLAMGMLVVLPLWGETVVAAVELLVPHPLKQTYEDISYGIKTPSPVATKVWKVGLDGLRALRLAWDNGDCR